MKKCGPLVKKCGPLMKKSGPLGWICNRTKLSSVQPNCLRCNQTVFGATKLCFGATKLRFGATKLRFGATKKNSL